MNPSMHTKRVLPFLTARSAALCCINGPVYTIIINCITASTNVVVQYPSPHAGQLTKSNGFHFEVTFYDGKNIIFRYTCACTFIFLACQPQVIALYKVCQPAVSRWIHHLYFKSWKKLLAFYW